MSRILRAVVCAIVWPYADVFIFLLVAGLTAWGCL